MSVEYYHVLGLYNKYYNKWYMEVADEVLWDHNKPMAMKAWHIIASMVWKIGKRILKMCNQMHHRH